MFLKKVDVEWGCPRKMLAAVGVWHITWRSACFTLQVRNHDCRKPGLMSGRTPQHINKITSHPPTSHKYSNGGSVLCSAHEKPSGLLAAVVRVFQYHLLLLSVPLSSPPQNTPSDFCLSHPATDLNVFPLPVSCCLFLCTHLSNIFRLCLFAPTRPDGE